MPNKNQNPQNDLASITRPPSTEERELRKATDSAFDNYGIPKGPQSEVRIHAPRASQAVDLGQEAVKSQVTAGLLPEGPVAASDPNHQK